MAIHAGLATGGWTRLTLVEQLGNIGSEVDRALRSWELNRVERFEKALDRALELFDLTASDERWSGHRRREILRAREEFVRVFFDPDVPADSAAGLSRYFLQFATLARRRKQT